MLVYHNARLISIKDRLEALVGSLLARASQVIRPATWERKHTTTFKMAVLLFIIAVTVCRLVRDPRSRTGEQGKGKIGWSEKAEECIKLQLQTPISVFEQVRGLLCGFLCRYLTTFLLSYSRSLLEANLVLSAVSYT
jgi:hypothetical protein